MQHILAFAVLGLFAQDSTKGGQEKTSFQKAQFPFEGEVTANHLYVRLAPKTDPTSAPVASLKAGARVTVVGEKDDFYQIHPPAGCSVWIYAKHVKREGAEGVVTVNDTPVRSDSRVTADKLASLNEGEKVKILGEHMGWLKIEAPTAVRYYVGKKYVKSVGPAHDIKTDKKDDKTAKPDEDALALAKIREAETLIAEVNRRIESGDLENVDFGRIVALFEEAASIAKSEPVKKEAEAGAKNYRHLQTVWETYRQQRKTIAEQIEKLREERAKMNRTPEKKYAFAGYVDCTSWSMADRPGTHKLMAGDKIVCFLKFKDGDDAMRRKLNDHYKRYVGVNGTIVKDPKGWEGYSVVIVEEIVTISK